METINFNDIKDIFSEHAPGYFVYGTDRTDEVILFLFVTGFIVIFLVLIFSLYDIKRNK